jgi:hypothetical protein
MAPLRLGAFWRIFAFPPLERALTGTESRCFDTPVCYALGISGRSCWTCKLI